ncbi:helix-turn-helix domain-containing protein [Mesorhizobium sp. B2-6-4]|nr:helix-turn-helix domain-containing protein [Mesorhizobium sp. B2-6-4]TPN42409.1 helix-turn-helix domain-containing protein [Mesorhizobium sp. B1-1-6]
MLIFVTVREFSLEMLSQYGTEATIYKHSGLGGGIVLWVSTKRLADRLAVSDRTIRYWAARGMIPGAARIGRQFRFRLTEVDHWLNNMDVSHKQRKVQEWPTFTLEKDQQSTKRASASGATPSENQLGLNVQRLLSRRQTVLNKS